MQNGVWDFLLFFFFPCSLCNINCSCNGSTPLVGASVIQYDGNSFSSEGRDLMSNLGTVVGMPNSFLNESAPIIELKRPASEVTHERNLRIPDVTLVPVMLALFVAGKLIEGNSIKVELCFQHFTQFPDRS